jgi:anti-sigma factor (TIGR02949 family)
MISCKEALQHLYEYLDGELTPADTEEVRRHIDVCGRCYPEVRMTSEFKEALQRAAQGQPCCPDGLRDRVARLLRNEGVSPASDP